MRSSSASSKNPRWNDEGLVKIRAIESGWLVGILSAIVASAALPRAANAADTLMPMGDAWARDSINVTSFRNDPITTAGDQQYAAYYNADRHVVIARRTIGQTEWTTSVTALTGNTADAHNGISMIADGDGYLHISWDHHGNPLHYARSKTPNSTDFETLPMTGQTERNVTYPLVQVQRASHFGRHYLLEALPILAMQRAIVEESRGVDDPP